MAVSYNLGCPVLWSEWSAGLEAALGTMTFYKSTDHSILKDVYMDDQGLQAWDNPLTLDQYGRSTGPIYFKNDSDDDNYYIVCETENGTTIWTIDNYQAPPTGQTNNPSNVNEDVNFVRNGQFLVWDHEPVTYTGGTTIVTTYVNVNELEQVCDEWFFQKSVTGTTVDSFSRQAFNAGQTDVPGNPRYFMRYQCTSNSGGETKRQLVQKFHKNAQFLQGASIAFTIAAKADNSNRQLKLIWGQNFGTGGSPSSTVEETLQTFNLTTSWQTLNVVAEVPSTAGKTLGTNYDDYSYFMLQFDLNTNETIDITNVAILQNDQTLPFPVDTYEGYKSQFLDEFRIPTGQITMNVFGNQAQTDQAGWLLMQDQTIGNPNSGANYKKLNAFNLYVYLWNTVSDTYASVLPSRGADAVSDWNASKTITLPSTMGRLQGNSGAGFGLTSRDPGQFGGHENAVGAHTHAFGPGGVGRVPRSNTNNFGTAGVSGPGGVPAVDLNATVDNIFATESSGTGDQGLPPFTFWPTYIHL
ncbi:MAG: hypothetical protein EKK56_00935 [Flavobacteriaceae bacterium]|nr:MAG: hypothetical protein EKK56_00935 [Flavobacteriaceae bacterium]